MQNSGSAPRLVRSFVQHIRATPGEVFPLLCPEREKEWLPGWAARMIHSLSGFAERGAIFETPHEAGKTLWMVTEYDPPRRVAFARWQPDGVMVHIDIGLSPSGAEGTAVSICYTFTAVDESGAAALSAMSEEGWRANMTFWERSMNAWFEAQRQSRSPLR